MQSLGTGVGTGIEYMGTGVVRSAKKGYNYMGTSLHNLTHPREIQLKSIIDTKIEDINKDGADDKTITLKEVSLFVEKLYKELKSEAPQIDQAGGANEVSNDRAGLVDGTTESDQANQSEELAVMQFNVLKNVDKKISNTGALDITNSANFSKLSDKEKIKVKTMCLSLVCDIIVFVIKMLHVNAMLKPYDDKIRQSYQNMINKANSKEAKDLILKEYIGLFKVNAGSAGGGKLPNLFGRKNKEIKKELDYLAEFNELKGYAVLENSMVKNIEGLINGEEVGLALQVLPESRSLCSVLVL